MPMSFMLIEPQPLIQFPLHLAKVILSHGATLATTWKMCIVVHANVQRAPRKYVDVSMQIHYEKEK